jgi:YidC/Oxa1 family membrane protein insertase
MTGLPYLVLVLGVMGTSYYQQYQITARNKYNPNATVNAQQQMIMRVLPLFFGFISLTLPSGLIVYFLTSNLYRIGLQAYITRRYYHKAFAEAAAAGKATSEVIDVKEAKEPKGAKSAKDAKAAKPKPSGSSTRPTPSRPGSAKPAPSRATPPKGSTPPAKRPHPRPQPKKPKS